jgi:glycosyltransferase involved in cell wall biosynthesis
VITLNEEQNLARCLESVRGLASEIVVLDSGSVDRTGQIARDFGAVFETRPWQGHVAQKNAALRRCTQPWVLCLDADEALSPELARSIRQLFATGQPNENGFWMNRRTFYLGDWIHHAWSPEWKLRLVRAGHAAWGGLDPHDKLEADGTTGRLAGDLLHYPPFRDFHDHVTKAIKYARVAADAYAAAGRRANLYNLLLSPAAVVFKYLFVKQGWRDGWRGWLILVAKLLNVLAKYAFLLEKQHTAADSARRP